MAYCVECGVKLEEGLKQCPLCYREVIAPPELIGKTELYLFPPKEGKSTKSSPRLDKTRKGVIELIITFMAIAVITLFITSFAHSSFSPYLPVGCTIIGGLYFLIALVKKPTYIGLSSWYVVLTMLLLSLIELTGGTFTWALYADLSLIFYWLVAVLPFFRKGRRQIPLLIIAAVSVIPYMIALDYLMGSFPSWSLYVALPVYLVVIICALLLMLRIYRGNPTITDIVLSLITISSLAVVAGNFFYLRYLKREQLLTWSKSVAIVSLCMIGFLVLNLTVRKVRHFFHNRIV